MNSKKSKLEFIDLAAQQSCIKENIDAAIARVLSHGKYIMGPEVKQLERNLAEFTNTKYVLTCANGTDALTLVMMAWGVGPGDAVFVPSFTYVATAGTPAQLGATPFFVDVIEESFNINPTSFAQAIDEAKSKGLRPAVVIPVDLFGQPADVDSITEIATSEKIKILVDGAQSFGANSKGRMVGSMGHATTTSFFPAKPLGCYGDGGAVFTNDEDLAELVSSIRLHGRGNEKYDNIRVGLNSRLDTIQAAILIEKLKIFKDELFLREQVVKTYKANLPQKIQKPVLVNHVSSAWAQYTVVVSNRDLVRQTLNKHNIPSAIYYPKPLTQQAGYTIFPVVSTGVRVSEYLSQSVLSLPMHPYLSSDDICVIASILDSV